MVREGNPFWVWEAEIPGDYCEALIKRTKEGALHDASIGGHIGIGAGGGVVDKNRRDTDICWVDDRLDPVSLLMFNYALRANINAEWFLDISGIDSVQLSQYKDGGFYEAHHDAGIGTENAFGVTRKLSVVLMLSEEDAYEGGDLVIKLNKDFVVPRKRGTIVVFPSPTFHTVTPVTKGERFTAVAWTLGKPWR